MKRLTIAALTLLVAVAFSTPTSATVYWQENFDGYVEGTGLNGQLGPNGMTWDSGWDLWNDPDIGSMGIDLSGQNGTFGAGYWTGDTTGGTNNSGSQIQMGTKVTGGMLYVDYDLHVGTGRQSAPQWWLRDTDTNINVSIAADWVDNANGGMDPQNGFGFQNDSNIFWDTEITEVTENIHASYVIDLDNKQATFTFTSYEEPGSTASLSAGYDDDWFPDKVYLYNSAIASTIGMGYDNFCIASGPGECTEFSAPSPGTDFEWTSADSGDWGNTKSWTVVEGTAAGAPPGNQAADQSSWHTATFGNAIGSDARTVFTDSSVTVNSISFINTMGGSYRISGGPSVNVNASTVGTAASVGVAAGSHEFQVPFGIQSATEVNVAADATLTFNNALSLNGQTLSKTGDGTMTVNNVLSAGGGTVQGLAGTISGSGTVGGDLDNSGATVAPGNSSGVLAVDGSYTQGSGGTLAMEIEGLAGPGEGGHDQLAVTGTASLDGTLDVTPIGGYADPAVRGNSDSFTLLTSTGLSGTFATVNYDGAALDSGGHAGNGLFRKVDYTANDVVFTNLLAKSGDVEGDSDVDITDFNALASNYDPSGANAPHDWTEGDFDDNDTIDLTDFNGLASNFSPGGYGGGADQVPEPASWVLAAMAILAGTSLIGRVWRR